MSLDLTGWEKPERGELFVVAGASGTGKSTLVRAALEAVPHLGFSVSVTTRPPRATERDGVDYHFISDAAFDDLLARDALLEWAQVYGRRYGTPREPVLEALARGDSILLDIDTQGAAQVRRRFPQAVSIFVLPPSLAALEARLRSRSTDSEEVIRRRLAEAHLQLRECGTFDHLLVNEHLPAAHDQFQAILVSHLLLRSRRGPWIRRILEQVPANADIE